MAGSLNRQVEEHARVIAAAFEDVAGLELIADRIIACFESGGTLYLLGNGGSAADAQHIAAELVGRFKHDRRPLPALALTTDTSVLTAIANDLGADQCFARQVEALVTERDVVWALSVSGRSPNVLEALRRARDIGAQIIGFTTQLGAPMKELCDYRFVVDHSISDRVQEAHQLAYHLVCDRIEQHFLNRQTIGDGRSASSAPAARTTP